MPLCVSHLVCVSDGVDFLIFVDPLNLKINYYDVPIMCCVRYVMHILVN